MSFTVTKTKITLTKGDTFSLPVHFHQPITGAVITIRLHQKNKITPVIEKLISTHTAPAEGKSILLLEKELTDTLLEGSYPIEMFITFSDGNKYTFYPPQPDLTAELVIKNPVLKEV